MAPEPFKKQKKGELPSILVDFAAYVVFVISILVFYLIFSFQVKGVNTIQSASIFDKDIFLTSYLKTPVMVDGIETNMAELIRYWYLDKEKYEDLLRKTSVELLNHNEYEYEDSLTKNTRVRGYSITIRKGINNDDKFKVLLTLESKSFQNYCISDIRGCANLGEQVLPVSENVNLYIVLFEGQQAKK